MVDHDDDVGALQVVEALLAGTIILTAVLFLTATSSPTPSTAESGLDLVRVSKDTLELMLNGEPFENYDEGVPTLAPVYSNRLEEIVTIAMGRHSTDAADYATRNQEAEDYIRDVLPVGMRFQLRLDNGVEALQMLPIDSSFRTEPRAAKAAETFITPPWQSNVAGCTTTTGPYFPGGAGPTLSALDVLVAPNGATIAPGGDTWSVWWADNDEDSNANTIVPYSAPYGLWETSQGSGDCIRIALPSGTSSDHPIYGVQLVVWPIAG